MGESMIKYFVAVYKTIFLLVHHILNAINNWSLDLFSSESMSSDTDYRVCLCDTVA